VRARPARPCAAMAERASGVGFGGSSAAAAAAAELASAFVSAGHSSFQDDEQRGERTRERDAGFENGGTPNAAESRRMSDLQATLFAEMQQRCADPTLMASDEKVRPEYQQQLDDTERGFLEQHRLMELDAKRRELDTVELELAEFRKARQSKLALRARPRLPSTLYGARKLESSSRMTPKAAPSSSLPERAHKVARVELQQAPFSNAGSLVAYEAGEGSSSTSCSDASAEDTESKTRAVTR